VGGEARSDQKQRVEDRIGGGAVAFDLEPAG
jgi:hypothetical protein